MKDIIFIYDNINMPNKRIKTIIGDKSFADILLKRKKLYEKYIEELEDKKYIKASYRVDDKNSLLGLKQVLNGYENVNIVHLFSNFIFTDVEQFNILIEKSRFINERVIVKRKEKAIMLMFNNIKEYNRFIDNYDMKDELIESNEDSSIITESFTNLQDFDSFLRYISGGFDARFFNSMITDENIVIKRSKDIEKIKKEYTYYQLLPEEEKKWMVMPYNYEENDKFASYMMERIYMPDLAIRWIHGAIDISEFDKILDKLFFYINNRKTRKTTKDVFIKESNKLYIEKLEKRIEQLKEHPKYSILKEYIKNGTEYNNIDEIIEKYKQEYNKVIKKEKDFYEVVGHGDLCFSNILYNDETKMIRFIDPKGALVEEELWTNPYYDIAKLSHSICGLYDFFNCGLYDIVLNEDLRFDLKIDFNNEKYSELFKRKLLDNNIDYKKIRIYEASLFLSMLPLHMDYPKKVFGFLLNGLSILNDI